MKLNEIYKKIVALDEAMNEAASASINMSGDNAEDVIKLMNALKGKEGASDIADIPTAIKPKAPMMGPMDPHDDMKSMMSLVSDEPKPMDDMACDDTDTEASGDYDNSPDEKYQDHNFMTKDIATVHDGAQKKSYPKVAGGDNPMALEDEIRAELSAALAEKMQDVAETDCGCDTHEDHDDCNDDCPPHSVNEAKEGKMPSKAHVKKMCKDGKSEAEMLKMHPDADKDKLKAMIKDCKKEMKESVEEGKFKKTGKDGDGAFDESGCVGEMKKLKASGCAKHEMYDKVAEKYGCSKGQFEKLYASNCG